MRYKKISLLPYEMQRQKLARKIKLWMIGIQIGVFFVLGTTFLLFSLWERMVENRTHNLTMHIETFDGTPVIVAMRVDETRRMLEFFEEYYRENFPVEFDTVWVITIMEKLPENARLTRISYRRQEILVEGEVEDLMDMEAHRVGLLEADFFETAQQGRVVLLDSGMFSYELRIGVRLNED